MQIRLNKAFKTHNTSQRWGKIVYLVIHYVGAIGGAEANVNYYNKPTTTNASADFFVGHNGEVWQYNPDPKKRYCWAVGGSKYKNGGGLFYGKATNKNTIHIEMCVKNSTSNMSANSPGWFITEKTLKATIELTKHLMAEHGIPAENVIRHFDVNGKPCPGVVGWNPLTGSDAAWKSFHAAIGGKQESGLPYMVRVTIEDLNIRTGPGTAYSSKGHIKPGVYTIVEENGIWLKLKSGEGWISGKYAAKL